jgi:hemerythrin-like domain-containing protein
MTEAKKRPARPAVAALPPLEALEQTHRQVMLTLAQLAQMLERLADQGVDDVVQTQAKAIGDFLSQEARHHHAQEDLHVFPSLLESGDAALVAHVVRLQQDHGWLEEDWIELAPQLDALARGYSWYDLDALRSGIEVFTQLYHEHIALEESLIYPEARRRQALLAEQAQARKAQADVS